MIRLKITVQFLWMEAPIEVKIRDIKKIHRKLLLHYRYQNLCMNIALRRAAYVGVAYRIHFALRNSKSKIQSVQRILYQFQVPVLLVGRIIDFIFLNEVALL